VTSQRDNFPRQTRDILAKRAGQLCSNPDCRITTSGPHDDAHKTIDLGVAAHISAASPGGPRYNRHMSSEERSSISNGIWLCQNCAKLVDSDTTRFPEQLLIIWKRVHEEFVKGQMGATYKANTSVLSPGRLNVSAVYPHWPDDGRSCILDIRVSNQGASDLMINAVELQVIESIQKAPLGQAKYSALYDLDISKLAEYMSRTECRVSQILKPGEADRFGIVLSAPTLQIFAGWRLATLFKTNFGDIHGPEIEVWLPRPEKLISFAEVTQFIAEKIASKVDSQGIVQGAEVKSEPCKHAGYKTFILMGTAIMWYYGPQPLVLI